MKALILENEVVQVAEQEFPVAPPLVWMDCDAECIAGWCLMDGKLCAPVVKPKSKEELLLQDMPTDAEKLEAIWDNVAKNDRTKLDAVLLKEQDALAKHA